MRRATDDVRRATAAAAADGGRRRPARTGGKRAGASAPGAPGASGASPVIDQARAVQLLARAAAPAQVAAALGVDAEQVDALAVRSAEEIASAAWARAQLAVPRAIELLIRQLGTADSPWIAQGAARILIDVARGQAAAAAASPVVVFGSAPEPGMPARDDLI